MKYPLIGMLCLSILVVSGCQSYPKYPTYPAYTKHMPVNHFVPEELQPYELPPKVQYMDAKQTVPKTIIVATPVVVSNVESVANKTESAVVEPVTDSVGAKAVIPEISKDIAPAMPYTMPTPAVITPPVTTPIVVPAMSQPSSEDNIHAK